MNCAQRTGVYALLISLSICSQSNASYAKSSKNHATVTELDSVSNTNAYSVSGAPAYPVKFKWDKDHKLSWDDFKGPVKAMSEESAAATNCAICFKTSATDSNGHRYIIVYNSFYVDQSWVRTDAKLASILDHEQGHFDLCEIYTRKLRQRMSNFSFQVSNVNAALMSIYTELKAEYETRQQAYEAETIHGTDLASQKKWQNMIINELSSTQLLASN